MMDEKLVALVQDAFSEERLLSDADAFDRAADALHRIGSPNGDIEQDESYRRGVVYGHMVDVMRLRELARARRQMARENKGKVWEANGPEAA